MAYWFKCSELKIFWYFPNSLEGQAVLKRVKITHIDNLSGKAGKKCAVEIGGDDYRKWEGRAGIASDSHN